MVENSVRQKTAQIQPVEQSNYAQYIYSNPFKLLTFSYLHGYELFHKIALTSKKIRALLPGAGLLDQIIVIGIKASDRYLPDVITIGSFLYAVSLADSIRVTIDLA